MTAQVQRGSRVNLNPIRFLVNGSKEAAVAANDIIGRVVMPGPGRIRAVNCDAGGAGSGAGSTVLDLQVNGTSVWSATGNRPALATADTGSFLNPTPDAGIVKQGDVVTWKVISIPASTGHTLVGASAAVELA